MRYKLREMTSLDELDARILELMTEEPRIGLVEVARRLGVARGTVQSRLAKLTERGAVTGFGAQVEPPRIGYPVLAFLFLGVPPGRLNRAGEADGGRPQGARAP